MALLPLAGQAAGLGPAAGEAVLGEPLHVEVPLSAGAADKPLEPACIELQRPATAVDEEYFPRDLSFRFETTASGGRLVLTTRAVIRQPVVQFRVFVTCGANLVRDYLLLASPRGAAAAAAPEKARPPTAPSPAPAPAPERGRFPDGMAAKGLVLERETTLEEIARQQFPGPLRRERFIRWVVEANPAQFAGGGEPRRLRLAAGTRLWIPDGVPPRRPEDNAPPKEAAEAPKAAAAPAEPGHRAPARPEADKAGGAPRKDRLVVGGGAPVRSLKETVELVDRLTAMMEQQVAAQTASQERVQRLETTLADLAKYVATLEAGAKEREAQWRAEREAERRAREEEERRKWWQLPLAILLGGVLGAGVLHGLRARAGRHGSPAVEDFSPAAVWQAAAAQETADQEAAATERPDAAAPALGGEDELPAFLQESAPPVRSEPLRPEPAPYEPAAYKPAPPAFEPVSLAVPAAVAPATSGIETLARSVFSAAPIEFEPPGAEAPAAEPAAAVPPAIELVDVMTSMGMFGQAVQTLEEHLAQHPAESLEPWIKLLSLLARSGKEAEFERAAGEMRQHFNVSATWPMPEGDQGESLENYPHIVALVTKLWPTPACAEHLAALLRDTREGTRAGFPLPAAEDILLLLATAAERERL